MAYATVEELAAALRVPVTTGNEDRLQECVDAAAAEIDHWLGRDDLVDPLPVPAPALVVQVNIARGVEHWKAADAVLGQVGTDTTGRLTVDDDDFAKHAADLMPFVSSFGVA